MSSDRQIGSQKQGRDVQVLYSWNEHVKFKKVVTYNGQDYYNNELPRDAIQPNLVSNPPVTEYMPPVLENQAKPPTFHYIRQRTEFVKMFRPKVKLQYQFAQDGSVPNEEQNPELYTYFLVWSWGDMRNYFHPNPLIQPEVELYLSKFGNPVA